MTKAQQQLAIEAQKWCDENEKSTEFMIQYICDVAEMDYDEVIEFLTKSKKNGKVSTVVK